MENQRYEAVIFDFFGVISSEVSVRWLAQRIPHEKAEAEEESLTAALDRGEEAIGPFFERVAKIYSMQSDNVRREWNDLIAINSDVVHIIASLKTAYKTALCSNAASDYIRPILEKNALAVLFDTIVVSGELHIAKPDPRIFEYTLERLGVSPEESIFIDDNPRNVAAAEALGMTGIVFTSAEDLSGTLRTLLGP